MMELGRLPKGGEAEAVTGRDGMGPVVAEVGTVACLAIVAALAVGGTKHAWGTALIGTLLAVLGTGVGIAAPSIGWRAPLVALVLMLLALLLL